METQNLWPDFPTEEIKGPKAVLKEQAGYLAAKTNNMLAADVETNQYKGKMTHSFYIVAPALNKYRYRIFTVEHGAIYYPARVSWDEKEDENDRTQVYFPDVYNEEELISQLREIFTAHGTIKIVSSLLSQSIAEQADQLF